MLIFRMELDSNQYLIILQIIVMPLYYPTNENIRVLGIEPRTIGLKGHCSTNWAIQKKITLAGFEPALYNLEG